MQNLISICTLLSFIVFLIVAMPDSLGGPFPPSAHRCHQKPKRCLPLQPCVGIPVSPLLFHPSAKGSQIVMDMAQRTVKRQASFCNAITFSNRPIALYEQVRLKVRTQEELVSSDKPLSSSYDAIERNSVPTLLKLMRENISYDVKSTTTDFEQKK